MAALAERGAPVAVLTRDALLAAALRREGVDARLPVDLLDPETIVDRDRLALCHAQSAFGEPGDPADGPESYGSCVQYGLIPTFMRAVGNVTAIADQLVASAVDRIVTIGGGALPEAAALVAAGRDLPVERVGGGLLRRASDGVRRLIAARDTKWVSTEFRTIVLEPAFLALLFVRGLGRRLLAGRPRPEGNRALVVVADRFTLGILHRIRPDGVTVIVGGATQPGRALLAGRRDLLTIERFSQPADVWRVMQSAARMAGFARRLRRNREHHARFVVAETHYWPLVARAVLLHAVIWFPLLRHLEALLERIAQACPHTQIVVHEDATAYNRTAVRAARRLSLHSVGLQHGLLGERNGQSGSRLDAILIWGPATEDFFEPPKPAFIVTGNPRFDSLAETARAARPPRQGPFTVVICTGFVQMFTVCATNHDNLLMIDAVVAWAASRPDVQVIHKIHPGEGTASYEAAAERLGWDAKGLTRISDPILHELITRSDVLVAGYSTTVIEALALGTRAIVFDAVSRRRSLPLERIPGVSIAESIDQLHRHLDQLYALPAGDRAAPSATPELREYVSRLDGQATSRVIEVLKAWEAWSPAPSRADGHAT